MDVVDIIKKSIRRVISPPKLDSFQVAARLKNIC